MHNTRGSLPELQFLLLIDKSPHGLEFLKVVLRNQQLSLKSKGCALSPACVPALPIHYLPFTWCHYDEWSWKSYIALHICLTTQNKLCEKELWNWQYWSHLQCPMWAQGWHAKFHARVRHFFNQFIIHALSWQMLTAAYGVCDRFVLLQIVFSYHKVVNIIKTNALINTSNKTTHGGITLDQDRGVNTKFKEMLW